MDESKPNDNGENIVTNKTHLKAHQHSLARLNLDSPTELPNACGYLWNKTMLIQMNCRGYAVAQFMQPEPSKYSHGPSLEAKTFIQPEHPYFAHHPGRFVYVKDRATKQVFSVPYEPCRSELQDYNFSIGHHDIKWSIVQQGISLEWTLTLPLEGAAELWSLTISNISDESKQISIYPYFTVGYKSWMNQSGHFDESLNAIVADSVTPYQQVADYDKNKDLKDITYLLADEKPTSWSANQSMFEGEGGINRPSDIVNDQLSQSIAVYETPLAVLQYDVELISNEVKRYNFIFGAAKNKSELAQLKQKYFGSANSFDEKIKQYQSYMTSQQGKLCIDMADSQYSNFVNQWLPRQVFYHGDTNRLTTDPQTRNYLQDNMGLSYLNPIKARQAFVTAMSQQAISGALPDGILLHENAELKYINQVPHADHSVWLAICLKAYLDETNDMALLKQKVAFADSSIEETVSFHIEQSLNHLIEARDYRGLSLIEQGDWCDPMNMVGHKGKGVSTWLTLATAYAINCWLYVVKHYLSDYSSVKVAQYQKVVKELNQSVNAHMWDGSWYARGRTDDDIAFGVKKDIEGRIFINPQSWALLSGAAGIAKQFSMLNEVERQLNTPFGVMMLAPSYTKIREDVGRLTQKHPGVAENGSVYNHAAVFYAYSLYQVGEYNQAFQALQKMIPTQADMIKRGQLPNYIPNYYRGSYYQYPDHAGRSSHLFNTGTVAWVYRCIVEELLGLKGCAGELHINPKLPDCIPKISGTRHFLESKFTFDIIKTDTLTVTVYQNEEKLRDNIVREFEPGQHYSLMIHVPK